MASEAAEAPSSAAADVPGSTSASASASASASESTGERPKSYLLLFNVGKRQNWGTLLRSACAFGVTEVIVVGARKLALFGNQGTAGHAPLRYFDTLEAAKAHLASVGARLCGIEIADEAVPVQRLPFQGSTAFMLGNEGTGMTPQQRAACDCFVYIPQHSAATASLNVAVAGSIVLHHFAVWSGMPEQARQGEKFVTEPARSALDRFMTPTEAEREEIERKRAARAAKRRVEDPGDTAAAGGCPDQEDDDEDEGSADN